MENIAGRPPPYNNLSSEAPDNAERAPTREALSRTAHELAADLDEEHRAGFIRGYVNAKLRHAGMSVRPTDVLIGRAPFSDLARKARGRDPRRAQPSQVSRSVEGTSDGDGDPPPSWPPLARRSRGGVS